MKLKGQLTTDELISHLRELEKVWEIACRRPVTRRSDDRSVGPTTPQKPCVSPTLDGGKNRRIGEERGGPSSSVTNGGHGSSGARDDQKKVNESRPSSKQVSSLRHAVIASRVQQDQKRSPFKQRCTSSPQGRRSPSHRNVVPANRSGRPAKETSSSSNASPSAPSSPSTPPCVRGQWIRGTSRSPRPRQAFDANNSKCTTPCERGGSPSRKNGKPVGDPRGQNLQMKNYRVPKQEEKTNLDLPVVDRTQVYRSGQVMKRKKEEDEKNTPISYKKERGGGNRRCPPPPPPSAPSPPSLPLSASPPSQEHHPPRPRPFKVCSAEAVDVLIVTPLSKTIVSSSGSWNSVGSPPSNLQSTSLLSTSQDGGMAADSVDWAPPAARREPSPYRRQEGSSSSTLEERESGSPVSDSPGYRRHTLGDASPEKWKGRRTLSPDLTEWRDRKGKRGGQKGNGYDPHRTEVACHHCGSKSHKPRSKFCSNCGEPLT